LVAFRIQVAFTGLNPLSGVTFAGKGSMFAEDGSGNKWVNPIYIEPVSILNSSIPGIGGGGSTQGINILGTSIATSLIGTIHYSFSLASISV
jgi:hypothetical protein